MADPTDSPVIREAIGDNGTDFTLQQFDSAGVPVGPLQAISALTHHGR